MDTVLKLNEPDEDGAAGETFTTHGLRRQTHSADKIGDYSNKWRGQIVLTTAQDITDELQVQRDIESLVIAGAIPMFGHNWRLAAIAFSWTPTHEELRLMGKDTRCLIRVTYHSETIGLSGQEIRERLNTMGLGEQPPAPDEEQPF